jgi:hypothetical protein
MSLWDVSLAFAPVGALFVGAAWWRAGSRPSGQVVRSQLAEALVLTLIGALWIGSLGHGSWVLLFALLGVNRFGFQRPFTRAEVKPMALGLLVYVAAGAILAWRLG